MPQRAPLPPELTTTPFAVAAARSLGVTADRLRSRDLTRPFHGVRTVVPPTDLRMLCAAYLPRLGDGHVFSHITAARLWQMPLPQYLEDSRVHVSAPARNRAPASSGIAGHQYELSAGDISRIGDLPVTSPAKTWCQLAETLPPHELVALGDTSSREILMRTCCHSRRWSSSQQCIAHVWAAVGHEGEPSRYP